MKFPLHIKVSIVYSIITLFSLLILAVVLNNQNTKFFHENLTEELTAYAQVAATLYPQITAPQQLDLSDLGFKIDSRLTLINQKGAVIAESDFNPLEMENHLDRFEIQQALRGQQASATRYSSTLGEEHYYIAVPIYDLNNNIVGAARASKSLAQIQGNLATLRNTILTTAVILLVITLVIGYFMMHALTSSLRNLTDYAKKIGQGNFNLRLASVSNKDEITELKSVLNQMSSNLHEKITALESQKNQTLEIFKSLPLGVVVVNQNNEIELVNDLFYQLLNLKPSPTQSKNLFNLISEAPLVDYITAMKAAKNNTQPQEIVLSKQRKTLQATAALLGEKNQYMIIVLQDISRIKKLEQIRKDFVANVSHELKTPLTSIKGFVETLLLGALKEEETAEKFLQTINKETERLSRLINDILTLASVEGSSDLDAGLFDLKQGVDEAISLIKIALTAKNITVKTELTKNLKVRMSSDDLIQVIINLLDNAQKYSPPHSTIFIKSEIQKDQICLLISDQGVGIPPSDQIRIFERFYRVDRGRSRELGGTGLGLSIVKNIMEKYGGGVEVESVVNKGSTFKLFFPYTHQ